MDYGHNEQSLNDLPIKCNKHGNDPINQCTSIKRLISLLTTYSDLDIEHNNDDQNTLIVQLTEYKQFLNDYIHLLTDHQHQLELINKSLEPCDISKCKYTSRHHRRDDIHGAYNEDDARLFVFSANAGVMPLPLLQRLAWNSSLG